MTHSPVADTTRRSEAVDALLKAAAGRPGVWTLGYLDSTGPLRSTEPSDIAEPDREAQLEDQATALKQLTDRLYHYAERHQLRLVFTYVDLPGEDSRGFRELLARIERNRPHQVLVTSLDHLASAAVELNGETSSETKHERLQRLKVPIVEVQP